MIKVIRYEDWCDVYEDDKLIYSNHNMDDALEAYCDFHGISFVVEEGDEE